jgi:DNA-binding MarR family transcriptional regulator
VVDALVEARLVERRPDPDDRRAILVAPPTGRGEEVAAGIRAARAAEAEGFFAHPDEADRASLARILRSAAM